MSGAVKGIMKVVSSIFGGGGDKPEPPKLEPKKTAPLPNDRESRRAMQKSVSRRRKGKGRAGTMLSDDNNLG